MENKTPIRAGILEARRTPGAVLSEEREATPADDKVAYVVWKREDRPYLLDLIGGPTGNECYCVDDNLVSTLLRKLREDEWGFCICAGTPGSWDRVVVDVEGMFDALKGLMPTPETNDGHCPVCGRGRIMSDPDDRTRWVCVTGCNEFFM